MLRIRSSLTRDKWVVFLFDMKGSEVNHQWYGKNVDLGMLTERIVPFFYETDFETKVEKTQEGYVIRVVSKIPNLRIAINVGITGQPNKFTVEFSSDGKRGFFSRSMIAGYLTMMFGGGYLISSEAKKRETLSMIENDFWRHAHVQVADLVNSATRTKKQSKALKS
jgi:hypothetical protein